MQALCIWPWRLQCAISSRRSGNRISAFYGIFMLGTSLLEPQNGNKKSTAEHNRRRQLLSGSQPISVDAAEGEIAREDQADPVGFVFDDCKLAISKLIAQRHRPADPETLAFGGRHL